MPAVGAANAIENWGATRRAKRDRKRRNNTTQKSKASAAKSFMDKLRAFIEKLAAQIREGKDSITITIPTGFAKKLVEFFQRLFGKGKAAVANEAEAKLPPIPSFRYNNGGLPVNANYNEKYLEALMGDDY